jgi:thioredoxin-like negative regulator of GroEL
MKSVYKIIFFMIALGCLFFFGTKEGMTTEKIIFFTEKKCAECKDIYVTWQELYTLYGNKLSMVDCSKPISKETEMIMKQYSITKIPTLIGIQNGKVTYFDATNKMDSLKGFISLQIGPPPPPEHLGQNHQQTIRPKT